MISYVAWAIALYSVSHDNLDIVFCFFDFHEIVEFFHMRLNLSHNIHINLFYYMICIICHVLGNFSDT